MSRKGSRKCGLITLAALMVAVTLCSAVKADDPPGTGTGGVGGGGANNATIDFIGGTPAAGGFAGQINASVQWKNCTGVNSVEVGIYKTVNNQQKVVKTVSVSSGVLQPLLADGTYSWNIATGEQTGTKITSATADAFDANGKGIPPQKQLNNLNVLVP